MQEEVEKLIKLGDLTLEDQNIIHAWITQISFYGPESIRGNNRWADHELEDEWKGYRSSSFSNKGRIIYKVKEKLIKISIARITTTHNYNKKG